MTIVDQGLHSVVEDSFEFSLEAHGDILTEISIHLLVSCDIVEPVGHSKVFLLGLNVILVIGIGFIAFSQVLFVVHDGESSVVLVSNIIVVYEEVDVIGAFLEIATHDAGDGLVLHEGHGVSPLIRDHSYRTEVAIVVVELVQTINQTVADHDALQIDSEGPISYVSYELTLILSARAGM